MNTILRWYPVINKSGESIPARAAMEPVSRNANGSMNVVKPNRDDSATALINGDSVIGVDAGGFGTWGWPVPAYYNLADGNPVNKETIGTRAGYWQLHRGYDGFIVLGGADGKRVYVQRDLTCRNPTSGGGYGYLYGSTSRVCCMCARFTNDPASFPSTLTATITVSCIGTRTITLTGGAVSGGDFVGEPGGSGCLKVPANDADPKAFYSGNYGALVAIGNPATDFYESKTDCSSGASTLGPWSPQEYLAINLGCYLDPCYDSGEIKYRNLWLMRYYWNKVQPGNINIVEGQMYNGIVSCSPFAISKTGVFQCYDVRLSSPCDYVELHGYRDNNWSTYTSCVGGTVQVDIDE